MANYLGFAIGISSYLGLPRFQIHLARLPKETWLISLQEAFKKNGVSNLRKGIDMELTLTCPRLLCGNLAWWCLMRNNSSGPDAHVKNLLVRLPPLHDEGCWNSTAVLLFGFRKDIAAEEKCFQDASLESELAIPSPIWVNLWWAL